MQLPSFSKPKDYVDEIFGPIKEHLDIANSYQESSEPTPFAFVTPSFQTEALDGQYDYYNHFNGTYYNILHRGREPSKSITQNTPTDDKKELKEVVLEHNGQRIILEVEGDPFKTIHDAFNQTYNPDHFEDTDIADKSQKKEPLDSLHVENMDKANKSIEMHQDYDERGPTTVQAYNSITLKIKAGAKKQKTKEPFKIQQDYDEDTDRPTSSQIDNSTATDNDKVNKQQLKESLAPHQNEQEAERDKDKVEKEESTQKVLDENDLIVSSTQEESSIISTSMQGSQTLQLRGCLKFNPIAF